MHTRMSVVLVPSAYKRGSAGAQHGRRRAQDEHHRRAGLLRRLPRHSATALQPSPSAPARRRARRRWVRPSRHHLGARGRGHPRWRGLNVYRNPNDRVEDRAISIGHAHGEHQPVQDRRPAEQHAYRKERAPGIRDVEPAQRRTRRQADGLCTHDCRCTDPAESAPGSDSRCRRAASPAVAPHGSIDQLLLGRSREGLLTWLGAPGEGSNDAGTWMHLRGADGAIT
jgi:hypothetical protein